VIVDVKEESRHSMRVKTMQTSCKDKEICANTSSH